LLSSALIAGDSIQYFITAQDSAIVPNVAATVVTLSNVPATAALDAGSFPVSGKYQRVYDFKSTCSNYHSIKCGRCLL
jgi:hypothetical protein